MLGFIGLSASKVLIARYGFFFTKQRAVPGFGERRLWQIAKNCFGYNMALNLMRRALITNHFIRRRTIMPKKLIFLTSFVLTMVLATVTRANWVAYNDLSDGNGGTAALGMNVTTHTYLDTEKALIPANSTGT
jgi:hypothetical protein